MATMKEIADAAGVSQATVSRVINNGPKVGNKTRERVKNIIKELNYRPNANARALATSRSDAVGVVIADLYEPFFAALAHGVETVARQNDTQILISGGTIGEEPEQKAISTLMGHRCDAMVVHSKSLPDETLVAIAEEVPGFVLINRYIPQIASRCVWLDNKAGGRMMAEFMVRQGHRKFAIISSDFPIEDPEHRIEGIIEALAEAGIELTDTNVEYGPPNQEGGEAAIQNLLSKGAEFTAVLAYNDAMASGAMTMLMDHDFDIPNDISVIGYDDILLAKYCRPKLTTLRYPIEMMASRATELALQYAQGIHPEPGTTYKYQPTIVKRDSVKKR